MAGGHCDGRITSQEQGWLLVPPRPGQNEQNYPAACALPLGTLRSLRMTHLVAWVLRATQRVDSLNKRRGYSDFRRGILRLYINKMTLICFSLYKLIQYDAIPWEIITFGRCDKTEFLNLYSRSSDLSPSLTHQIYVLRGSDGTPSQLISSHQCWLVITKGISGSRALPGENFGFGNNLCGEDFPKPHILFKEEAGLCNKDIIKKTSTD